jgi:hypothetical protein
MSPRVFLCEPSALNGRQRALSDAWHERLFGLGFDVDQLRSNEYQPDPWSGLLQRIEAADGVLVMGFGQLFVRSGTWRAGTRQERPLTATWTSPWLHVECGMALAAGVPLLVAAECGVSEGAFASPVWTGVVQGTTADKPDEAVIAEWAHRVVGRCAIPKPLRRRAF